jgi:uncharacterized Fe-S cluster-containing radical SAM superfamily protein
VEVFASHGAELDEPTVGQAVKERLRQIRERSQKQSTKIVRRMNLVVDAQPARQIVVRFYDKKMKAWFVEDFVEVLKDGDRFSLYLRTPRDYYEKDRPLFEAILASFRFQKSDKEPIKSRSDRFSSS